MPPLCHSGIKPTQKAFSAAFPLPFVLLDFEKITPVVRKQNGRFIQQEMIAVFPRKSCL